MQISDIVQLIDLTSLNDNDTPEVIEHLCKSAETPIAKVAAVCVYPQFVKQAAQALLGIPVATVVNFPAATDSLETVLSETEQALADGADEIDLVLPYRDTDENALTMVKAVKQLCLENNALLKVIIESGAFEHIDDIKHAATLAIDGGADFVKTSTGKISVGATPEAVEAICQTIADKNVSDSVGIKVSGGVRTLEEANRYLEIIAKQFGDDWVTSRRVRIGASALLKELLEKA